MSATEELLERKSSGSGIKIWEYGCRNPSRWPRGNLYPQKLVLSSRSLGRYTSLTESFLFMLSYNWAWRGSPQNSQNRGEDLNQHITNPRPINVHVIRSQQFQTPLHSDFINYSE
jgi:hypothetical protein